MSRYHNQHQKARTQFNRQAQYYADSAHFSTGKTLGLMEQYLQRLSPPTVLDVATGAGFTAIMAAQYAQQVIATDIAEELLALAQQSSERVRGAPVLFALGSAELMPIAAESIDMVTCRIAAHHFADIPQFLSECHRVLRPGGHIAFTDTICSANRIADEFLNSAEMMRDPSHVKCQSAIWWQPQFTHHGFQIDDWTIASNAELSLSSWAKRGGVSPEVLTQLRQKFATAPTDAVDAYQIRQADNDFHFYWPTLTCLLRKKILFNASDF